MEVLIPTGIILIPMGMILIPMRTILIPMGIILIPMKIPDQVLMAAIDPAHTKQEKIPARKEIVRNKY